VYFAVYYGLFRFFIVRFDLKTPGREPEEEAAALNAAPAPSAGGRGADFVIALGGSSNLVSIDACTTRLRLIVGDQKAVDEARLKALGARGIVRPSDKALQVVLGPIADTVAGEIRQAAGAGVQAPAVVAVASAKAADPATAQALLPGLGGAANIAAVSACSSRLRLELADPSKLDEAALKAAGVRALVRLDGPVVHLVLGPKAEAVAKALQEAVAV